MRTTPPFLKIYLIAGLLLAAAPAGAQSIPTFPNDCSDFSPSTAKPGTPCSELTPPGDRYPNLAKAGRKDGITPVSAKNCGSAPRGHLLCWSLAEQEKYYPCAGNEGQLLVKYIDDHVAARPDDGDAFAASYREKNPDVCKSYLAWAAAGKTDRTPKSVGTTNLAWSAPGGKNNSVQKDAPHHARQPDPPGVGVYQGPPCLEGDTSGDLPGFTRQCSGGARDVNAPLRWDNTFVSLFNRAWPGGLAGYSLIVYINANHYASFQLDTATSIGGLHLYPNNSFGPTTLVSVSTEPGYFAKALCPATSDLLVSTKPETTARCKLSPNTIYYLNFAVADYWPPHASQCESGTCPSAWAVDLYDVER